jgi:chemotaxis signal transduction protein
MLLTTSKPTALVDRYLLTEVGKYTLVFPANWVSEVLQIEQSKVLHLPHYSSEILGIANYQNNFLTLITGWQFLPETQSSRIDRFTVVRLGASMSNWQNIGVVIDRVLGSMEKKDFPPIQQDLFVMANPQLLFNHLWQPLSGIHHQ